MYISGTIFNLRQRVMQQMQTQADYNQYWQEFQNNYSFLQINWHSEIGYLNQIFKKRAELYHLTQS